MSTTILAKFPGSVFFQALTDGEPMAFVMLGGVIMLFVFAFAFKYMMSKAK